MKGALKITKLDTFTMKPYFSMYLLLVFLVILFSNMNTSAAVLCITCSWFIAAMASNLFAIEEKNNLSRLYGTLSVRLKDIVLGRYIFILLTYVLAIIGVILLSFGITFFKSKPIHMQELSLGISVSFLIFSIIVGVQMPLFFKMGYMKARFLSLIPFVPMMLLVVLPSFSSKLPKLVNFALSNQNIFIIIGFIVSFIILIISYNMSLMFYRKRR